MNISISPKADALETGSQISVYMRQLWIVSVSVLRAHTFLELLPRCYKLVLQIFIDPARGLSKVQQARIFGFVELTAFLFSRSPLEGGVFSAQTPHFWYR
jgi:hypothetical protein